MVIGHLAPHKPIPMKNLILPLCALLLTVTMKAQQMAPATNEFLVNQEISGSQTYPSVASDEHGGYVITWVHTNNMIMARRYGADHQPLTDQITVAPGDQARVYYWSEGRYVITWNGNPTGMKVLNADNSLSTTYTMGGVEGIDMDIRGDQVVVVSTASQHIRIRKWNLLTNAWMGAAVQVSEAPNANYRYPQVRWTSTGGIVAVYSGGSATQHIYRKTFNADLLAQIPEASLQSTTGSMRSIGISINAQDQLFICSSVGTGNGVGYTTRVVDAAGDVLMASAMNSFAWNGYGNVPCGVFDNGSLVAANSFSTSLNDPEGYNVRANYGLSLGSPNTGYQIASNTVTGEQRYPDMAKLPNAGFILVWNGNGFQGDSDGVYARAFHAAANPGLAATIPLPLVLDETGTTGALGLRLATPPNGNVVVDLAVSDPSEASINTAQLTFTTANWSQSQSVIVTGLDDAEDDGDITLHVIATMNAATTATAYVNLPAQQFAVVNRDDDATFTMPAEQTFCRSAGITDVVMNVTNNGDPVGQPSAVSDDQAVVPDAAISVVQVNATTFHISVAALHGQPPGTATITVSVTDGSFTYSDHFEVTTLGAAPIITWVDMELVSTAASSYQWYLDGAPITGATTQAIAPPTNGSYTVSTTDTNGCTATSAPYLFMTVGIDTPGTLAGTHVYPVPANEHLVVESDATVNTLLLLDMSGRTVLTERATGHRTVLSIGHLAKGSYMLRLVAPTGEQRTPVIVQ